MTFRANWLPPLPRTPWSIALAALLSLVVLGVLAIGITALILTPGLPSVRVLAQHQFAAPLRIYTRGGQLIGQFGEQNRVPVTLKQVPALQIKALLAAEDADFYSEPGVNFGGFLRAALADFRAGAKVQGASTITMQVARDYFLSPQKTYTRKIKEILLAFKLNRRFTKNQILELYINKVFLGNHAYGLGAAAEIYYGRSLAQLNVAQMAMLAGLPKAPSADNPVRNPARAQARRAYVLGRMHTLGFISSAEQNQANGQSVLVHLHGLKFAVQAPYVAEMVREYMAAHYNAQASAAGFRVYTTISARDQAAADQAVRSGLLAYDRRHGYRGPLAHVRLPGHASLARLDGLLKDYNPVANLLPAVITGVGTQSVYAYTQEGDRVEVPWAGLSWARRYLSATGMGPVPTRAGDILRRGDIVDLEQRPQGWWLAEAPTAESALVSLRPQDGALLALSGGFDFYLSNFNRATQALRQPGSGFKPFIYSAALQKGFTAASRLSGAPIVVNDPSLEEQWRPQDYTKKFFGPTRLRKALALSLNLVAVRLLRAIGPNYAADYLARFGFDPKAVPHDLSLVLGTASVTPMQMASAFSVFANGGYRVQPYFISRIEDASQQVLEQAHPAVAPAPGAPSRPASVAPRAINPDNAFIMTSMMKDVVRYGTGAAAAALGRSDIAGKTGTTNNQRDAWFTGFSPDVVTSVWVGFDQPASLGHQEVGAIAALPIWMRYMKTALAGLPQLPSTPPPGIVVATINRDSGALTVPTDPRAMREYFVEGTEPAAAAPGAPAAPGGGPAPAQNVRQGLF